MTQIMAGFTLETFLGDDMGNTVMTQAEVAAYRTGGVSMPANDLSLSSRGRNAQRSGVAWEQVIEDAACRTGTVRIQRVPNGARFIGPGKIIPVKSPFDFCGAFVANGRGLFFDAKSCGPQCASFPFNNDKVVEDHQICALSLMADAGAVAGLLVRCERLGAALWLGAGHLLRRERIAWDDPRWLSMGPADEPDFSRLMGLAL